MSDNVVRFPTPTLPELIGDMRRRQAEMLNEVAARVRDATLSSCVQLCLDLAEVGESAQGCADALRRIRLNLAEADQCLVELNNVIPGEFGEPR